MKKDDIRIYIENVRAISRADIKLDGITVLAGENGCGKSTISKLTYHLFKTSIDYDKLVRHNFEEQVRNIRSVLNQVTRDLVYFLSKEEYIEVRSSYRKLLTDNNQLKFFDEYYKEVETLINYLIEIFDRIFEREIDPHLISRFRRLKRILENSTKFNNNEDNDIIGLLENLKKRLVAAEKRAKSYSEKRPSSILDQKLDEAFYDVPLKKSYNLFEYDVPIIDRENNRLLPIHSIENIAYIDTPMILGINVWDGERSHWDDINQILTQSKFSRVSHDNLIENILHKEILKGDVNAVEKDFNETFVYKRNDGKEFDLLECATGLKSFAILQILFKKGLLNEKTLLIIDEPEVHLHPQWVVEYARLIVLLNRHLGVKFLIASHHPDMISAIRFISEKEKNLNVLNFYLANKDESNYSYNYEELGVDIEDIFSSFNIALERIDLYGATS